MNSKFRFALFLLLVAVTARICLYPSQGWHFITSSLSVEEETAAQARLLSQQPFHYLGEGGQAFVFVSDDGRYVLKLLRSDRLQPAWWVNWLPNSFPFNRFRREHVAKRARKLNDAMAGYHLAAVFLPAESGILAAHLAPSPASRSVLFTDKRGIGQEADLSRTVFIIQEKGEMLSTLFARLLDQGEVEEVKKRIDQVFALCLSEYQKGIYDRDHGVMHNMGFVNERPIHLDFGKLVLEEKILQPPYYRAELRRVAQKILEWIHECYPHFEEELRIDIEKKLESV